MYNILQDNTFKREPTTYLEKSTEVKIKSLEIYREIENYLIPGEESSRMPETVWTTENTPTRFATPTHSQCI